MTKQQNTDAILATDGNLWTASQLKALSAKDVAGLASLFEFATSQPDAPEGDELEPVTGSKVKQAYRVKYAEIAKQQGRKATTAGGRASLNNGDELALLLERATPEQVCRLADVTKQLPLGTTLAKYTTDRIGQTHPKTGAALKPLNDGMVRMNAGNQVRSYCKKADDTADAMRMVTAWMQEMADEQARIASGEEQPEGQEAA